MLLALTCFVVLIIVLRTLGFRPWIGAVIAAAITIALKPWLATLGLDWRVGMGVGTGVGLLLLPYYLGPIRVHGNQRIPATARFEPFDRSDEQTPESVAASIQAAMASLSVAGFRRVGDALQANITSATSTRVTVLERESTGQIALCVGSWLDADPTRLVANYVEVVASLSDGRTLIVNNTGSVSVFARDPQKTIEKLPSVHDAVQLATAHERLLGSMRRDDSQPIRLITEDVPTFLAGSVAREMTTQVALGYFRLDTQEAVYRPTWKGAVLMCWKMLPPWRTLARTSLQRRETQLLAQLGMTPPEAKPIPALPIAPRLSWAWIAALGLIAAYFAGGRSARAGALEPAPHASVVPADFEVPNDFPGAVRALESLARATARPLMVRDSLGNRIKTSGAVVDVSAELADTIIAGAQQAFLARGFFLFRHAPNYGLQGRADELALVPVWDQYRVVKSVGTNGATRGISNADIITWLRELEKDAPFVLIGIGDDHIEGRFTGRLPDPEAMARRLHAFCPDIVDQGTGSVTDLASELRQRNAFLCWWD